MALPPQPTSVGFHSAPVCKCLAVVAGGLHLASRVPALANTFRKIFIVPESIESLEDAVRILGSKLVYLDTKNVVLSCIIIYFFRVFERRYGSLKFSTNLLISWIVSLSLELVSEQLFETRSFGPISLLMPLFIPWFIQIPVVSASRYGPVSLSSKSINYLLGLQIALASNASLVSTFCGLASGLLVYCTPLQKLSLPGWVGTLFSSTIGKLVCTYPLKDSGLMGATLEIQRSQQTEAIEQQLIRARNRYNVPVNGGGRQLRLDEMWGGQGGAGRGGLPRGFAGFGGPAGGGGGFGGGQAVVPSPAHLQTLQDMGFSRQRAEQALRQSGNNLDDATNILLHEM